MNMPTFLNPKGHKNSFGHFPEVSVDDTWPDAGLIARPNDVLGQKILDYQKRWSGNENFPSSPWDDRAGTISLIPPDEVRPATDPIPRYRMREDGFIGCNLYLKNQEVAFAGWPVRPHTLQPINESAERVLSYMNRYGAGRTLPKMPHQAGVLCLPNPATTFGTPQSYMIRGSVGDLRPV
jgi:hypothetical protein